jgi:hypothetical protein
MLKILSRIFFGLGLSVSLFVAVAVAGENPAKKSKRAEEPVKIIATPVGPSQEIVNAAKMRAEQSEAVRQALNGAKYRLISLEYVENAAALPTRFRVIFYDYTNDRTLVAEGDFAGKGPVTVRQEAFQPIVSPEEFGEAVQILQADARFTNALKSEKLKTYPPMPDITVLDGTTERLINVGLEAQDSGGQNEVVSVSLKRGEVIRYAEGAPPTSKAAPEACGLQNSGQGATSRGVAGQATLTVIQGETTLWEMLVIRPSASSGTRASGLEIRDVKYKGKSVLKRGHVPILSVQYIPQTCGPYRDWQYAEGFFSAPDAGSQNPAPGIRILANGQIATTALETGNDMGNFQGVAIYTQNNETVLVSEMNADWYRYIMEWRLGNDGSIRPRFGFGAVKNGCVCNAHHHHVYWRLDFDIVQPNNTVFQVERGRKFLQPISTEINRNKNTQTNRSLLIQNSAGNEAYLLVPNISDGLVDSFGRNDLWVLRYKNVPGGTALQNEIDDGWNSVGGACTTTSGSCINIQSFVNGESVVDQDVVVWYGAHFMHNDGANLLDPDRSGQILSGSHVVGPDLRPVRW